MLTHLRFIHAQLVSTSVEYYAEAMLLFCMAQKSTYSLECITILICPEFSTECEFESQTAGTLNYAYLILISKFFLAIHVIGMVEHTPPEAHSAIYQVNTVTKDLNGSTLQKRDGYFNLAQVISVVVII